MIKRILKNSRSVLWTLGLVAFVLAGTQWLNTHHQEQVEKRDAYVHQVVGKPYIHAGNKAKPITTARRGDLIYVHNEYIRTERCEMRVANLLIGKDSNAVHHWTTFNNWLDKGTWVADEIFVLPKFMPPGPYRIVKKTVAKCGDETYFFVNFDVELVLR
ncbi:hypothetical protein FF100_22020 [Methylobacterium terricola]|uniref:Uncharacterized protein n=1 Tax=Methylobacterium terricola TaxID=2583531 RepID=A0A5C4LCT4_9HYPH|nr:hypothetical protein [Methylobacterium terricola]TNC10830.1 hypothetical protein FF100_22020 [Methylobacterium terricola]